MGFSGLLAAADRAALAVLGAAIVYTPGTGSPVSVSGIFDAAYVKVDAGTPGMSSSGPSVFLRLADLPSDPSSDDGATVTVDGVSFTIWEVQPDGLGGVLLHLHRA